MSAQNKKSWTGLVVLSLISLVILTGISLLVLLAFGRVVGEEFSPDDFSRRRFEYLRIPGLNWVVRGIEYQDRTSDFEKSLGIDGWITTTPSQTWHLYQESQTVQPAECDARFLVEMLTKPSGSSEYQYHWEEWTQQHPKLAKVFWPLIAQMARDELYLAIPEIMHWAEQVQHHSDATDVPAFETELNQRLAAAYKQMAEMDQANGRAERAQIRKRRAADLEIE